MLYERGRESRPAGAGVQARNLNSRKASPASSWPRSCRARPWPSRGPLGSEGCPTSNSSGCIHVSPLYCAYYTHLSCNDRPVSRHGGSGAHASPISAAARHGLSGVCRWASRVQSRRYKKGCCRSKTASGGVCAAGMFSRSGMAGACRHSWSVSLTRHGLGRRRWKRRRTRYCLSRSRLPWVA